MTRWVKEYWAGATPAQRFALALGSALVLSGLLHFGLLFSTGSAWEGAVSYRKPGAFSLSFGITTITLAMVMGPVRVRNRVQWLLLGPFSVAMVLEVGLATVQFWRSVPSHFNFATSFDAELPSEGV